MRLKKRIILGVMSAITAGSMFSVSAVEASPAVEFGGGFAQKAMRGIDGGNTYWEKALWLNVDGKMSNGWSAHAGLDWKFGSSDGFNSEKSSSDDYVGGDNVKVAGSFWDVYVKGPVAKNTEVKFGHFQPGLQSGYVSNARVYGAEVDYTVDDKSTVKLYGGKIREKKWDMAVSGNQGFLRNGGRGASGGSDDNGKDIPTAYGVSFEHKFDDRVSAGIGYYNYKSPAYDNENLNIVLADGSYKLSDDWGVTAFYSQGSKGYQNRAYDAKFTYNGSPWGSNKMGGYIGYRHLGSDAVIMSSLVHGSEKAGSKGIEAGIWYRFSPNIVLTNDFFLGKAIEQDYVSNKGTHGAFFSSLIFSF